MHIDTHIHLHEYTCITSRLPNIPQYKSRYIILNNIELEAGWDMIFDFTLYYINYTKHYSILHISYAKRETCVYNNIIEHIYIYICIIICTRKLLSNQGSTRCCEVDSTWINVGPSELDMDGSPSCGGFKPQLSHLAFLWISMAFCGCKHCKPFCFYFLEMVVEI